MVKTFRPCLAFLSGLLCALCLALSAVSVVYADDWQERDVSLSDSSFYFQRMITVNGLTQWLSADQQAQNGTSKDTVNALGLMIVPSFGSEAFAIQGRISLSFVAPDYGDSFSFSSAVALLYHDDGSVEYQPVTASPRWSDSFWVDVDLNLLSSRHLSSIHIWLYFPDDLGTTSYVYNCMSDASFSNLVVGYGSQLSPTFPGSGLSRSDIPHDRVSAMGDLESTIHEGTSYDFDQANDLINGLPDRLDEWGSSFSFVRLLTSNFIDRLPWLDTLLSVSLALGVIALLLNLSAWIGRASKK